MTDTTLKTIPMLPGILSDTTEYAAEGTWVDCDKIRFRNGRAEKLGGWVKETMQQADIDNGGFTTGFSIGFDVDGESAAVGGFSTGFSIGFNATDDVTKFTGVARDIISWADLDSEQYLAVGTHKKVEILHNGQIYDVTPVRDTVTLVNKMSATLDSRSVSINDVNHGLTTGDEVEVTTANSPIGGIVLDGVYPVDDVTDADNFTVLAGSYANATVASAGGTIVIDYLLENGYQDNGDLTGWGGGAWNTPGASSGGWNMPRSGVGGSTLRQWSMDTWGEDMLACVRGGKIYQWDATNGVTTRMVEVANAPSINNYILISQPSRHLIALGSEVYTTSAFDPLIIRWAQQESLTDWAITTTNSAGEYRLPKGNFIVGAIQTKREIIIFTDTSVYSMRFIGGNNVFQFECLEENSVNIASQHSAIATDNAVYWMGTDGFYMYNGKVHSLPTTVGKRIFDQEGDAKLNPDQHQKTFVGINKTYHEIWWFYPVQGASENSNYVKYNFVEKVWDYGTITRTVWLDKGGVFTVPYGVDDSGTLFIHESGYNDDAAPMNSFIRTAYFDLGDGEQMMFTDRTVPDIKLTSGRTVDISILTKKYPHPGSEVITKGPKTFSDTDKFASIRAKGRQMSILFESNTTDGYYELGKIRMSLQPDGER